MAARRRYPIRIQTFSTIREEGYIYVGKTQLVYDLAHENGRIIKEGRA